MISLSGCTVFHSARAVGAGLPPNRGFRARLGRQGLPTPGCRKRDIRIPDSLRGWCQLCGSFSHFAGSSSGQRIDQVASEYATDVLRGLHLLFYGWPGRSLLAFRGTTSQDMSQPYMTRSGRTAIGHSILPLLLQRRGLGLALLHFP